MKNLVTIAVMSIALALLPALGSRAWAETAPRPAAPSRNVVVPSQQMMRLRQGPTVTQPTMAPQPTAVQPSVLSPQMRAHLKSMPRMPVRDLTKTDVLSRRGIVVRDNAGAIVRTPGTARGRVDAVVVNARQRPIAVAGKAMIESTQGLIEGRFVVRLPGSGVGKGDFVYTYIIPKGEGLRNGCLYDPAGKLSVGTEGCPAAQPGNVDPKDSFQTTFEQGTQWVFDDADQTGQGVTSTSDQSSDTQDTTSQTGSTGGEEDDTISEWWEEDDDDTDDSGMINPMDDRGPSGPRSRPIDRAATLNFFTRRTVFVSIMTDVSGRGTVSFVPESGGGDFGPGVNPLARQGSVSLGGGAGDPGRGVGGVGPTPVQQGIVSLSGGAGDPGSGTVVPGPRPVQSGMVFIVPFDFLQ